MADRLRWGILATGGIAHQFAAGLKVSKTGTLVTTGSRNKEKADEFAAKHGGKGVGSYEELLADPEVDAVYIATPHHLHYENTIAAAQAGKAILCEKPFTLNSLEAERSLAVVRDCGVFFMEAFMYRCAPQSLKLKELVEAGEIGTPLVVNSEFGFQAGKGWQNFRANGAVGGGGLMDVGTYCVSLSRLIAGCEPIEASYCAFINEKGYDEHGNGVLRFPGGMTACFGTGIHVSLKNDARIYGSKGWIHVEDPWKCGKGSKMTLFRQGKDPEVFDLGMTNDELYGNEADTVAQYLERKQSPTMSLKDTLGQMRTLDMLRESAGFFFDQEPRS